MRMIKNYSLRVFLTVLVLCMTPLLWAQERAISGKAVDQMGSPLPGVSIVIKGTSKGTITDLEGAYKLAVPGTNSVLVFSYVGYKSQEVAVGNQTTVGVTLQEDAAQLEEIVIIGYGSVKKEDLTGSIQSVKASDFNQGAITSPQELIVGKMPGVQVTTNGGAPGAGATIRIRGGSSLSASNDPLIIIDGVPVDNGGINGASNPLATINPSDIETFTVLKDASATAIYGSRASNGVILITTKRGAQGGIKVDYSGTASLATPIKVIDVLNANQFREAVIKHYGVDHPAVSMLGTATTDWQSEVLRNAVSTDHNVAVSGSVAEVLPYRVSVGYNNANGILKTNKMERTTVGLNVNPLLLDGHLKVDVAAKYSYTDNRFADGGALSNALSMDPTQRRDFYWQTKDENGKMIPNALAPKNPISLLNDRNDVSNVNRFLGNIQLDYKFHFLPELRANLNLGYDQAKSEGTVDVIQNQGFDVDAYARGGAHRTYNQTKKNELLEFYLNYNKELPSMDSKLDVTGGYSWQHFWNEDYSREYFKGKQTDGKPWGDRQPEIIGRQENFLVSFFGRMNYTFKDRYMLTATMRADGSSKFAPDNRWGYFPAAALAWNIKKEDFLKESNTLSALKFRLGYGETGQQDVGDNYAYMSVSTYGQPTASYVFMEYDPITKTHKPRVVSTIRPQGYNPLLQWERTTTYNAAIDYGFFNDRVTGSLEVYRRTTDDLLNVIPVPVGANLTNQMLQNIGSLQNQGVELSVNTKLIQTEKLFWDFGVNATYNENEITKLTRSDDPSYIGVETGGISSGTGNTVKIHSVGYPANSFFVYEQVYNQAGKPIEGSYIDRNKDGVINEKDKYRTGQAAPKVMMGFSTRLTYGNWDFSASARAQFGGSIYNDVMAARGFYDALNIGGGQYLANVTTEIYESAMKQNDDRRIVSDYYIQKADFFRIDNVMVGYNFKPWGKYNVRLYGTVNNALLLTPYKGLDPEVFDGIDRNFYPRPRTFMLGLNLSL